MTNFKTVCRCIESRYHKGKKISIMSYFWHLSFQISWAFFKQNLGTKNLEIRQFIIYYAHSLVHLSKRTTDQSSDVPSIIFFFIISCKILCKNCSKLFHYFLIIKIKSFECPKSIRNYEKKCLEHQTLGRWLSWTNEPPNERNML